MTFQNLWAAAKAFLRGNFCNNTDLPQETRKITSKQHKQSSKEIRKGTNKSQSQQNKLIKTKEKNQSEIQ